MIYLATVSIKTLFVRRELHPSAAAGAGLRDGVAHHIPKDLHNILRSQRLVSTPT